MPPLIVPLVIAGISAAASHFAGGGGGGDQSALLKQQQDLQAQNEAKAKADELAAKQNLAKSALLHNSPDIQAQLGGSVSPDYYAQVVGTSTGQADQIDFMKRLQGIFGSQPSGGGGGFDISSLVGGGTPLSGGTPQQQQDLFQSSGNNTGLVG